MSTDLWYLDEPERFHSFRRVSEAISFVRGRATRSGSGQPQTGLDS